MASGEFVNLHNHSEYSLLDGYSHIEEYVRRAASIGQKSFALTDHGNLYGAIELITTCRRLAKDVDSKGKPQTPIFVKPIVGLEAYAAPENPMGAKCKDRIHYGTPEQKKDDVSANGSYLHLTLLAKNDEGFHNLIKLSTESFRPEHAINHIGRAIGRVDMSMLQRYSKGLIATTGCPSGEILTRFRLGQDDKAYEYAERMKDIFAGDYYVEVMDHHMKTDLERSMLPKLLKLSKDLNIPLLATNDAHYANPSDAPHHEELCCAQSKSYMSEATYSNGGKRFAFDGAGYYVKTYDEMIDIFPEDEFPGAVSNTNVIADSIEEYDIDLQHGLRPLVDIPKGYTERTWFQKQINDGFKAKRLDVGTSPVVLNEAKERIAKEYPVFADNDFIQYMLVVQDYINWARNNGIKVGNGRGSVGGSEIAYDMNISNTDPVQHQLIFERFLNPERLSPPDVDTDFEAARRDEVLTYVKSKYGEDHISNVITFQKFKPKLAFKDMARIYEVPFSEANRIAAFIPNNTNEVKVTLHGLFEKGSSCYPLGAEFRAEMSKPEHAKLLEAALALEGRVKTIGTHACAVIMCNQDISNWCPMQWDMGKDTKIWGENITQWPYEQCEALGLIKMDFLSLSDLDVVKNTIENIKHTTGEDINEMEILDGGLDDKETYQLLASGGTVGVFQMSSDGYKDLMVRMKPDNFEDISAALALYRPGPMGMNAHYDYADGKNNRIKVEVFDPAFAGSPLEKILKPTFQKIVYQEQVMQISSQMAGFTLGQADSLRKAMGHKKPEVMAQMKSKFVDGCLEHGYPKKPVEKLWGYIEKFSAYAFNKAHSAAYGLTSYETAYFKTHYPAEFMAAYMTDKIGSKDKLPLLIKECSKMGLKISGISINKSYGAITSARKNSADDPDIVFGFNAINGMSPTTSNKLVKARDENGGSFKDLDDVMKALPKELISKSIIENLAMVGAFDEFGLARRAVFVSAEDLVKFYKDIAANKAKGQASLFDMFAPNAGASKFRVPDIDDWSFTERLSKEKALMGIYVSSTPMHNLGPGLSYLKASYTGTPITPIEDIIGRANRGNFRTIAVFTEAEQRTNKKGQPFFNCTIEDETGSLSAKIFGNNAENILQSSGQPNVDSVYVITGSYFNGFGDRKTYSIEDISEVELTPDGKIPLWIRLTKAEYTNKGFDKVKDALRKCPGHLPVFFSIKNTDGTVTDDIFDADIDDSQESMIKIESIVGSKRLGKWN